MTIRTLEDSFLEKVGEFRAKSRIPILSMIHKNSQNKAGFCSLWRSSQPAVKFSDLQTGFFGKRCSEDEYFLQLIGNPSKTFSLEEYTSEKAKHMLCDTAIFDLRGKTAAIGNKFKGKGFESSLHYTNCEVCFEDIPNIHGVRDAFIPMAELADSDVGKVSSGC